MDTSTDRVATLGIEYFNGSYNVVDHMGKVYYTHPYRAYCEGFIAGMKYAQDNIFSIW